MANQENGEDNPVGSHLENLPPELRRILLFQLDLPSLKAVVLSSPIYHQQYRDDRKRLLSSSLQLTLGSGLADAYFIYEDGGPLVKNTPRKPDLSRLSELYAEPPQNLHWGIIEKISHYHLRCVEPVVQAFALYLLEDLADRTAGDDREIHHQFDIANTEKQRLIRAVYRFEILSLSLSRRFKSNAWLENLEMIARRFLDMFEAWEIEQVICFHNFVVLTYEEDIQEVFFHIHNLREGNRELNNLDRLPLPYRGWFLQSAQRKACIQGVVFQGVGLFSEVMLARSNIDRRASLMQDAICEMSPFFQEKAGGLLTKRSQVFWFKEVRLRKHERQVRRMACDFNGDDLDSPPLAWTRYWNGTYSCLFGDCIPKPLRFWGFVFWDSQRINEPRCRQMLDEYAQRITAVIDPREYFNRRRLE